MAHMTSTKLDWKQTFSNWSRLRFREVVSCAFNVITFLPQCSWKGEWWCFGWVEEQCRWTLPFVWTKDVVKDSEEHPKSSRSFGASRPKFVYDGIVVCVLDIGFISTDFDHFFFPLGLLARYLWLLMVFLPNWSVTRISGVWPCWQLKWKPTILLNRTSWRPKQGISINDPPKNQRCLGWCVVWIFLGLNFCGKACKGSSS